MWQGETVGSDVSPMQQIRGCAFGFGKSKHFDPFLLLGRSNDNPYDGCASMVRND
jgi:hypothetical protein